MIEKVKLGDAVLRNDTIYPESCPLDRVIPARRDTLSFTDDPIPEEVLHDILELGLLAPSGYNLQPWRFVVVRDPAVKRLLRDAAMGQKQVEEAPVVIAACGDPTAWTQDLEEMIRMGEDFGAVDDKTAATIRKNAPAYLKSTSPEMWVTRQVTIAFTHLMLAAEAYGLNTGPMEGFDEDKVRDVLNIPSHVRVIALLALGYRKGEEKPFGGRFGLHKTVYWNEYGCP